MSEKLNCFFVPRDEDPQLILIFNIFHYSQWLYIYFFSIKPCVVTKFVCIRYSMVNTDASYLQREPPCVLVIFSKTENLLLKIFALLTRGKNADNRRAVLSNRSPCRK